MSRAEGPPGGPDLEAALGHRFADPGLLERALTHASAGQERAAMHNERLEYLGDAVIDLVVAHALFEVHPGWREGELTWTRAALVNTRELAARARSVGLGDHLRLGKSERHGRGAHKDSILAGALEAVVGAVYLDGGLPAAEAVVRALFADALHPEAPPVPRDAKMRFQEWAHGVYRETPRWRIARDSGDEADPERFVAEACVGERVHGRGAGRTKRAAERAAARDALRRAEEEEAPDAPGPAPAGDAGDEPR